MYPVNQIGRKMNQYCGIGSVNFLRQEFAICGSFHEDFGEQRARNVLMHNLHCNMRTHIIFLLLFSLLSYSQANGR